MMVIRNFLNRKFELESLKQVFEMDGLRTVLIYGRRRIGKTFLIKEFIENKDGIYFLCLKRSVQENIDNFVKIGSRKGLPYIKANNLIEYFERLKNNLDGKVVIIDEFQYLIEKDQSILGDMQYIFDETLLQTNAMVILCGSSIGLIETVGSDLSSPLYGRFSARMKINKMSFWDLIEFHADRPFLEIIKIYGALGGVPFYHEYFTYENFEKNVINTFFNPSHILYSEAEFLLRYELRDISTYMSILHAIANGKTRVTEIANSIYIDAKDISKYLKTLQNLGLIEKITPITASPNSRLSRYNISDNYFRFWFKFVDPLKTQIEFGEINEAVDNLKKNYSMYLGHVIEDLIYDLLRKSYAIVGKWWYKENEIDIVAINTTKKEILYGEIKWTNKKIGITILENLKRKSELIKKYPDYKSNYILVSKSGFTEELKIENNVRLWDLKKIKSIVDNIRQS